MGVRFGADRTVPFVVDARAHVSVTCDSLGGTRTMRRWLRGVDRVAERAVARQAVRDHDQESLRDTGDFRRATPTIVALVERYAPPERSVSRVLAQHAVRRRPTHLELLTIVGQRPFVEARSALLEIVDADALNLAWRDDCGACGIRSDRFAHRRIELDRIRDVVCPDGEAIIGSRIGSDPSPPASGDSSSGVHWLEVSCAPLTIEGSRGSYRVHIGPPDRTFSIGSMTPGFLTDNGTATGPSVGVGGRVGAWFDVLEVDTSIVDVIPVP